ncbi:uncharacterized protein EDB93DRAFT_836599 [Suillus bovinus]|uniref:uncharacterized protein n=1 Tax=Suillus bovinus TaxID=48563 RepID=UPI001B882DA2|nr:uncharacterized protein EDB93DRAFT_836599 [Suillus bovinus]KAG2134907.1 hypothetical protein EDB93DRAFT_836599 [Suillus bovinus]
MMIMALIAPEIITWAMRQRLSARQVTRFEKLGYAMFAWRKDKSKGNAISKGLVMLQVAWFVMQLITRVIYRLETTQLEVGTPALVVLPNRTSFLMCNAHIQCTGSQTSPRGQTITSMSTVNDRDEFARLQILHRVFCSTIELIGWAENRTFRKLRVPTFKLEATDIFSAC